MMHISKLWKGSKILCNQQQACNQTGRKCKTSKGGTS
jgi:hypothetical protein